MSSAGGPPEDDSPINEGRRDTAPAPSAAGAAQQRDIQEVGLEQDARRRPLNAGMTTESMKDSCRSLLSSREETRDGLAVPLGDDGRDLRREADCHDQRRRRQ